jgi:hypothetical protein
MSKPSVIDQPHVYGADRHAAGLHPEGFRGLPTLGASQPPNISAALVTLQLQHADVSALASANRLLTARFLSIALNEERNARLLSHRLDMTIVRTPSPTLV